MAMTRIDGSTTRNWSLSLEDDGSITLERNSDEWRYRQGNAIHYRTEGLPIGRIILAGGVFVWSEGPGALGRSPEEVLQKIKWETALDVALRLHIDSMGGLYLKVESLKQTLRDALLDLDGAMLLKLVIEEQKTLE